jgi:hypothetical protein
MRRRTQLGLTIAVLVTLGLQSSASAPMPAGLVGSFRWYINDPAFGGLSAIEVDATGTGFIALSDRGNFFAGTLHRDSDGRIDGVADVVVTPVLGRDGKRLRKGKLDTEGLAIGKGGIYVSLEGPAQVVRFKTLTGGGKALASAGDFAGMQRNSSLEALAIDADGTLYTLPERSGRLDEPFPVYRFKDGWTQPFTIPRIGEYLPTAADFGPDGRLYVLEREFHGLLGFQSRVRRFVVKGDSIDAGEVLIETAIGQHDNLEGLSVWRDRDAKLRLTMISDDNFRFFQSTQIVEYAVPD